MLNKGLLLPQHVGQLNPEAKHAHPTSVHTCAHGSVPLYDTATITRMLEDDVMPTKPDACVRLDEAHGALIDRPVRSELNLTPEAGHFLTCPLNPHMTTSSTGQVLVPLTRINTMGCNDLTLDARDPMFDREPLVRTSRDRLLASGPRLENRVRCTASELTSFTSNAQMPGGSDATYCLLHL